MDNFSDGCSSEPQQKWINYVGAFLSTCRAEVNTLPAQEKFFAKEHAEEMLVSIPCQVEVREFHNPYRLIWLFLYDKSKPDLAISFRPENWTNLSKLVEELRAKYADLELDTARLHTMLDGFRDTNPENNFSIDGFKNVTGLCFLFDVRSSAPTKHLWHETNPEEVGDVIFNLNHCQSRDRY